MVYNPEIEEILNKDCGNKEVYKYRGKKYTFDRDRINWLQDQVRQYIDDGSKVYVILLLGKDAKGQAGKMSYGGGRSRMWCVLPSVYPYRPEQSFRFWYQSNWSPRRGSVPADLQSQHAQWREAVFVPDLSWHRHRLKVCCNRPEADG
jgi:hypothetical protein